jgi:hypothetical protein
MLFQFTPEDVQKARGTNHLDDMDTITSPHNGMLVVVAQKRDSSGMLEHVCWACGEPFEPEKRDLAGVEKVSPGGTVPVLLHRKCAGARKIISVGQATQGLQLRRAVAKGFKAAAEIAAGVSKIIVSE